MVFKVTNAALQTSLGAQVVQVQKPMVESIVWHQLSFTVPFSCCTFAMFLSKKFRWRKKQWRVKRGNMMPSLHRGSIINFSTPGILTSHWFGALCLIINGAEIKDRFGLLIPKSFSFFFLLLAWQLFQFVNCFDFFRPNVSCCGNLCMLFAWSESLFNQTCREGKKGLDFLLLLFVLGFFFLTSPIERNKFIRKLFFQDGEVNDVPIECHLCVLFSLIQSR